MSFLSRTNGFFHSVVTAGYGFSFSEIWNKFRRAGPAALILFSYLVAISLGTSLLMIPKATTSGHISFINALFTATSAVCVTGLIVVDTGTYFTPFGQGVILALIQMGGLGVMTFSVFFFLSIGKRVSFRQRMAVQETFAHTAREDIYHLIRSIFFFTAVVELIGVILLSVHWSEEYPFFKALHMGIFHAISAFCNAGFSLLSTSFMGYKDSLLLNLTVAGLIVLGGLGFPVVYEIYRKMRKRRVNCVKISLQTKAVLMTTSILILSGMFILLWAESNITLKDISFKERLLAALFQSVTARTAGFNTLDIGAMGNTSLSFIIFLMFVGASPGSCGGGVKTTTLALLGALMWARLRRRISVNMFNKTIPRETASKSVSLLILSIGLISIIFFLLLLSQEGHITNGADRKLFLESLFEVVSAFGTVGLSMGATAKINSLGKLLLVAMMLIGRVGVLTFSYIIAGSKGKNGIEHAEENLMIG